jgi:hypothetical protein
LSNNCPIVVTITVTVTVTIAVTIAVAVAVAVAVTVTIAVAAAAVAGSGCGRQCRKKAHFILKCWLFDLGQINLSYRCFWSRGTQLVASSSSGHRFIGKVSTIVYASNTMRTLLFQFYDVLDNN